MINVNALVQFVKSLERDTLCSIFDDKTFLITMTWTHTQLIKLGRLSAAIIVPCKLLWCPENKVC